MLEIQKNRLYEASRLRAHGASEDEIQALKNADKQPFRPAFVGGKRKRLTSETAASTFEVPTGQFKMPKHEA